MKINREKINDWLNELHKVQEEMSKIQSKYGPDDEWEESDAKRFDELVEKEKELTKGVGFGDVVTTEGFAKLIITILELALSE